MKKFRILFSVLIFAFASVSCELTRGAKADRVDTISGKKEAAETADPAAQQEQLTDVSGKYTYKTHREGKGGFDNSLEITLKERSEIHVTFSGTYFYLAGREETFHEGDGEGDGVLTGNAANVHFSGDNGDCRATFTFLPDQVTVKTVGNSGLNVDPSGIYKKAQTEKRAAVTKAVANEVCPDPAAPCRNAAGPFADHDLPFHMPTKLKPNVDYKSAPFYAILLKTYDEIECNDEDISTSVEKERVRLQSAFPGHKVFASYDCPNMDALSYAFPGQQDSSGKLLITTFIAVYAGKTEAEAEVFLAQTKANFANAQLKRMTVSYEEIDQ
ncbi:MAG: hypothetical protein ABI999_06045 [Acidobacteriota bacterium]